MSTKTTFKRIALVAVAALGLGVLSVAPSSAATTVIDETLTLSAASATVAIGETASVTITNTFTNTVASETSAVVVTGAGAVANDRGAGASLSGNKADSVNATFSTTDSQVVQSRAVKYTLLFGGGENGTRGWGGSTFETIGVNAPASIGNYVKATYTLNIAAVTTAGTFTYTIYSMGSAGTLNKSIQFTLTVTAPTSAGTAAYTKSFLNRAAEFAGAGAANFNLVATQAAVEGLRADSSIVSSAGTVSSPTKVGVLWFESRSSSDTKVVLSATQTRISDSITVTVSGPGLIASSGYLGAGVESAKSKQVIIGSEDSVIVYSDGTPGVATITSYKGTSVSAANVLATPKTVTFTGKATTFTTTLSTLSQGGNLTLTDTAVSGVAIITFLAKDSALNAVTSAALNVSQGMGAFYAVSSDTKVVRALNSATSQFITCAASATTAGKWSCDANVIDSGVVTLTIQDSTTGTAPTSAAAVSLTVTGAGYTGTAAFDKTSYAPGERALLTLTAKDYAGKAIIGSTATTWTSLAWKTLTPGAFTVPTLAADTDGGTFTSLTAYLVANSFNGGIDTVVAYMPTTVGTYTLTGKTGGATTASDIVTFTIVDPNAASIAAAKDASDAATDAALEATDAAYAATDAANIAAEAADAATAAAEAATDAANAAKESADAATAAVEELATSVAKLMAALQAQITTLAKVVAKIAVKVKA